MNLRQLSKYDAPFADPMSDTGLLAADLYKKGLREEAILHLEKASLKIPGNTEFISMLGKYYLLNGEINKGITQYRKLIKHRPDDAELYNLLGNAFCRAGKIREAESVFTKAMGMAPDNGYIHNNMAVLYWNSGNRLKAVKKIQHARELSPGNRDILLNCAAFLYALDMAEEAISLLTEYLVSNFDEEVQKELSRLQHDFELLKLSKAETDRKGIKKKQVVFICVRPRGREAKLAYGLRQHGWKVVLIHQEKPNFDISAFFDEIRTYNDISTAHSLAADYAPCIYHVFSTMVDDTSVSFVKHKPGIVIFDPNDVFEGTINDAVHKFPFQRFCIENADALCCRDLQIHHVTHKVGYRHPEKLIFFPEYCWDFPEYRTHSKRRSDNGDIHVVSIGNFGIEKLGEEEWGYLEIARRFAEQKVHFHIYLHWLWLSMPASVKDHHLSDYIDLSKTSEYFHLHPTVPMDQLIQEISKYDFGVNVIAAKVMGKRIKKYNDDHFKNCLSLRNIDYLDAGLPIIISRELNLQHFIAKKYGFTVDVSPEMFSNTKAYLKRFLSPDIKNKIVESRSNYTVKSQTKRLIAFYESLQSG